MKHFVEGLDRGQSTLFPETLEDFVAEDNAVRVGHKRTSSALLIYVRLWEWSRHSMSAF
jgi:hypothetical protein